MTSIKAVVAHHTATSPTTTDRAVANLLRDGHSTLRGPLSQLGLDRSGRYWVVADGRCNHNGLGTFGNNAIGIEAFNNGLGEAWPAVQVDAYCRGAAALLKRLGLTESRFVAHRETDPDRKVDPRGLNMEALRSRVATHIEGTSSATLTTDTSPPATLTQEPLLMAAAKDDNDARCALIRLWFWEFLGRGPNSAAERDTHLWTFASKGADACLTAITDSPEAAAYRKSG